jgi:hypothetical protein
LEENITWIIFNLVEKKNRFLWETPHFEWVLRIKDFPYARWSHARAKEHSPRQKRR